jgi:hypothetical protein
MEAYFFCSDCGAHHAEPAEAFLGHLILCLECEMRRGFDCAAHEAVAESSSIAA